MLIKLYRCYNNGYSIELFFYRFLGLSLTNLKTDYPENNKVMKLMSLFNWNLLVTTHENGCPILIQLYIMRFTWFSPTSQKEEVLNSHRNILNTLSTF